MSPPIFRHEDGSLNVLNIVLCGAAVVVLVSVARDGSKPPTTNRTETCSPEGVSAAFANSQNLVRRQLKAPSTADFPWTFSNREGIRVRHLGGCKFEVMSYVDAQNSFGAMLRTNYLAQMEYVPASDTWSGEAVLLE